MSDHDFEKKVQLKMGELKFRPSDAVWTGVEKKIRQDKRRRRAIFWLPVLFLALMSGGYLLFSGPLQPGEPALVKETPAVSQQPGSLPANTIPAPVTDKVKESSNTIKNNNENLPVDKTITQQHNTHSPLITKKATTQQPVATIQKENTPLSSETMQHSKKVRDQKNPVNRLLKNAGSEEKPVTGITRLNNAEREKEEVTAITTTAEETINTPEEVKNESLLKPVMIKPVLLPVIDTKLAVADSLTEKKEFIENNIIAYPVNNIVKIKLTPASKWQWGVQANGGFSGISKNGFFDLPAIFSDEKSLVEDLSDNVSSPVTNLNYAININPPLSRASAIRTGYSYSIGGFVQRRLSKRFDVSAGLHYSYLSVQTSTGKLVNSPRTVNVGASSSYLVGQYYSGPNEHNYTNRYHFIELPVTVHFTLNRSQRTPLRLDAGFSAAKMLTTNALHYDGISGIYYKDNSLFNKTQFGMHTGLNVGLFQQSKLPVSVGPVLRYSLTGLVKKEVSMGQYLWSTGLSVKMLLKK